MYYSLLYVLKYHGDICKIYVQGAMNSYIFCFNAVFLLYISCVWHRSVSLAGLWPNLVIFDVLASSLMKVFGH